MPNMIIKSKHTLLMHVCMINGVFDLAADISVYAPHGDSSVQQIHNFRFFCRAITEATTEAREKVLVY